MTHDEAYDRLESLLGNTADHDAALTGEELTRLLADSRVTDAAGVLPGAPGYVAVWDLDRAAAAGWRLKAARLATSSSPTGLDGDRSPDDYRYLHAIRQAEHHEARRLPPRLA